MSILIKVTIRPCHFHRNVPESKSAPLNLVSQQILSACNSLGTSQNGSFYLNSILGTSDSPLEVERGRTFSLTYTLCLSIPPCGVSPPWESFSPWEWGTIRWAELVLTISILLGPSASLTNFLVVRIEYCKLGIWGSQIHLRRLGMDLDLILKEILIEW